MDTICRAITFINYHIPLGPDLGKEPPYSTIGFFDGLFTERLAVDYEKQDLKALWRYTVKKTAENKGKYSYQNIFGFSEDKWNLYTDEAFWNQNAEIKFPLVFIVFLQLSDYMVGPYSIKRQCKEFNSILQKKLGEDGMFYSYGTIDKNDFVIAIRSRNYNKVVNAIKELHNIEGGVVYSYSIFSIARHVIDDMSEGKYPYLFEQYIDSICLKGITNSYNPYKEVTLDQRYYEFCDKVITKLYGEDEKKKPEAEREYRIYDIMGDDDFRLIARNVNLGKLLREFGVNGQLGYYQSDFRFYLYSSSLVLNTRTEDKCAIEACAKAKIMEQMNTYMVAPLCEQLSSKAEKIMEIVQKDCNDEKKVAFCQAVWQLLHSLKVLECAPTKKYDFYSLYHPFSALVRILEMRIEQPEIGDHDEIYEFIHKISMTIHGTLRTDIQFFQIRDFNVIVHYAPSKLRAFYAIWALKLSEFYNSFEENKKKYSFILSPGMFGKTNVQQLFLDYEETERLMLITIPERHLYIPKWLSVIIAHEVSHFVGTKIRNRKFRHETLVRVSARIATLEMQYFMYRALPEEFKAQAESVIKKTDYLQQSLESELLKIDEDICKEWGEFPYLYHSPESIETIRKDYRYVGLNNIKKIVYEYGEMLSEYFLTNQSGSAKKIDLQMLKTIRDAFNEREDKTLLFFERFQQAALSPVLHIINHLCSEAFADMVAILTLNFSPQSYVISFTKSECIGYQEDAQKGEIKLLPVRIAIVMEVVKRIVSGYRIWLNENNSNMVGSWMGDVFRETIFLLKNNSNEKDLMISTFGYRDGLRYQNESISNYSSIYNAEYEIETFSNRNLAFLNDKMVFDQLCEYVYVCARTYLERLKESDELRKKRKDLLDTYHVLSNGTVTDIMQEIENFLEQHESC